MNKNKHTAGRKVLFILSLILSFQLIQSCQKEGDFGINPMGISRSSSIDETIRAFQSETARQPQLPTRSMRQKAQKIPQWHLAEKVQISLGEALRVPLKYLKPISIRIADQYVPLEDLTYLLVYRDRTRKEHYEVVTRIPDTEYWIHRHEAGRRFSGTIIVEDWWGRPIKTFGKLSSGKFMHTSNPTLGSIFSIHNGEMTPLRRPDTQCGVSVVTNQYMMMEVEFICQGGEIEEPEDLPELYSDWDPSKRNFEMGAPGGHGGGRRNDNPPAPEDRPEINTPEEFLAEIDDSGLSPCFRTVLGDVKNLSNGSVAGIIQKFAGNTPGFNWKLTKANLAPDLNAITGTDYNRNTGTVTTTFNVNKFNNTSDLAVARTIMHEAVHAYLVAYFERDGRVENGGNFARDYPNLYNLYLKENGANNSNQHKEMSETFIAGIVTSLKEYSILKGYNLPEEYFRDMAWAGLQNTEAFKGLPQIDRDRILNLNSSEITGYDLNNNFIGIKGTLLCD